MKTLFIVLLVSILGSPTFSQNAATSSADRQLDSIIQLNPVFGKVSVIYFSDGIVQVDTIDLKRYKYGKYGKSDSIVTVKLKHGKEKRIRREDFWGMTTDYGLLLRLYHSKPLGMWRSTAPYVYKTEVGLSTLYFFSETATGSLYPLTEEYIQTTIQDQSTREALYGFIKSEHIPMENANKRDSYEFLYAAADVVADVMVTITLTIGRVLLESILTSLCK